MSRHLLRRAVELFRSDLVPHSVNKANRRAWLRMVHHLGPRWVLRNGPAKWGHTNQQGAK